MAHTDSIKPTLYAAHQSSSSSGSGSTFFDSDATWQWHISTVERSDGCKIRYGICRKGSQEPISRYLVLLNGRSEWIEKYQHVPAELDLPASTAILSLDHRGQGLSDGERGYISSYDTYADDLAAVLAASGVEDKPFDILAHSMGALITLYAYTKGKVQPDQLILSAPLLRLPNTTMPLAVMRPLMKSLTAVGMGSLEIPSGSDKQASAHDSVLTSWPAALRIIQQSQLPLPFVKPCWLSATFKALDWVFHKDALEEFTAPLTLFKAGLEQVVDNKGLDTWYRYAKLQQLPVELITFADAKHEILNERFDHRHAAIDCIRQRLSRAHPIATSKQRTKS